jgi:hypothetical protein
MFTSKRLRGAQGLLEKNPPRPKQAHKIGYKKEPLKLRALKELDRVWALTYRPRTTSTKMGVRPLLPSS